MRRLLPVLLMAIFCGTAHGQSLYKCTVKGKITYSGAPCKQGQEKAIEVPPAPPVDTRLAQEREREKDALSTLEAARGQRETVAARQQVDRGAAARDEHCIKLRLEKKQADQLAEGAPGKLKAAQRERARQMGEALALECQS